MSGTAGSGMDTVQELVRALSGTSGTVDRVAAELGTVLETHDGDYRALVQPHNRSFSEARVVPEMGTIDTANVSLQLADPDALTVQELEAAFGPYLEAMPLRWGRPIELIFQADLPNHPYGCSVIARVAEGLQDVADGVITEVIVQREIRLD